MIRSSFQKQRMILGWVLAFLAGATILLSLVARPERDPTLTVWTATENDVEVKLQITTDLSGQLWLSGTFTPTRPQFYLYSKDLPRAGLHGLGRPTLFEVTKSDSIKSTGPLEADQPAHEIYIETLDLSFPVYPAGPVTLRLPFERVSGSKAASMEVAITYMACSEKTCLPPVIDKYIFVEIPAEFFDD